MPIKRNHDPDNPAKQVSQTIRQDLVDLVDDYARYERSSRSKVMTQALKEFFKRQRLLQKDGVTPKKRWKRSRV